MRKNEKNKKVLEQGDKRMKLAMFQMGNAGSVENNLEKSLNAMKTK